MYEWQGKNCAVVGLGVSNIPVIRFLLQHGAKVTGRDSKTADELGERYQILQELGIHCLLGHDYLQGLTDYDYIFLTPGIPKHLPEIQEVIAKGKVLSEIELVLSYAKAPVFAITGSSGKTTTTTLVGKMLEASGVDCYVGGNIGQPLIEKVVDIPAEAIIVLELSSFQLELLKQSPDGALITNISENHLDIHLTMDNYIRAKKQIYLHQSPEQVLVLNYDDPLAEEMAEEAASQVYYFSMNEQVAQGTYLENDVLYYTDQAGKVEIIHRSEIGLIGEHNVANMLAAALFAHLAGASWEAIRQVAREFTGVPHRLEKVAVLDGVTYYNDSIATSPSRAIAGLKAFSAPLILIAGGYDKQLSFDELAKEISQRVKDLILIGETGPKIKKAMEDLAKEQGRITTVLHETDTLAQAVKLASRLAKPGDVVLLSPASASFDMYPSFVARGEHFRHLVRELESK
ncbi:MAG: UDP-N-acetylmuramoyl-L-alanine--D-glutamate ligase [Firmicutes bacterium]|nr:UDP-N-acetylmuramoyl-L-alanine--D-glutamate ligase [Bacillota bacterium]